MVYCGLLYSVGDCVDIPTKSVAVSWYSSVDGGFGGREEEEEEEKKKRRSSWRKERQGTASYKEEYLIRITGLTD